MFANKYYTNIFQTTRGRKQIILIYKYLSENYQLKHQKLHQNQLNQVEGPN